MTTRIDTAYRFAGKQAVKKTHPHAAIEAKMLRYLESYVHVPRIFEVNHTSLVMEYIQNDCKVDEVEAAKVLARLHSVGTFYYGFEFDTTIGPYKQPNPKTNLWSDFFARYRVLYMARACYDERKIDSSTLQKIETLAKRLEELLPKNPPVSLLHGDIWSGNVLCREGKIYFIDPALYFGHNEVELAFIMMFHTFGKRFFDVYSSYIPIEEEFFAYRYMIYQIYPYLVHVRSFGGQYILELQRLLGDILSL